MKRAMNRLIPLAALLATASVYAQSPEEKGLELAKKSDQSNTGFAGEKAEMELVLINAHGDRVTRKLLSRTRETEKDGDKSLVTFEWPADVKGTRMLTWTHKTSDDDQWLYLPSIKRVKRINSSNKSGSFMGSEFAYEDLGSTELEKYKFKFLKDDAFGGRKQWAIERVPVDDRSGYSRQVMWLDHEYLQPARIEYYDRKGELLKTAEFKGYQKLKGFWRASEIHMVNHQTQKQSLLTWKNRELGVAHTDSEFRSENLER